MAATYDKAIGTEPIPAADLPSGMDGAVDVNTYRDYNLGEMDVADGLHKFSWDDSLRTLATLNDVLDMSMSETVDLYANKGLSIPDAIGIKVQAGGASITHTWPVIDPYVGGTRAGINEDVQGFEKGHRLRYINAYFNEVGMGVVTAEYGIEANRVNAYGVYDSVNQRVAKFWAEIKGRMKREALTQIYNRELVKPGSTGSYSAGVTQGYNPNWFIANATANLKSGRGTYDVLNETGIDITAPIEINTGVTGVASGTAVLGDGTVIGVQTVDGVLYVNDATDEGIAEAAAAVALAASDDATDGYGMPIYTSTLADFEDNILTALNDSGSTTDGNLSTAYLDKVAFLAHEKLIEPLDDGTYVAIVPEPQWFSISALTGDLGSLWTSVARYNDSQKAVAFPGETGMYRNIRIVPDSRYATFSVAGTVAIPGAVTLGYQEPGGAQGDNRTRGLWADADGSLNYQLGWLCGKGAYIERMEKDLFYREELQNYGKKKGLGSFMECGYNLTLIRTDSATAGQADYVENRGSAVLAFSSTTL